MTTILFPRRSFVYLYSALPFFLYSDRKTFTFTSDPTFVEGRDTNRSIILLRWMNQENPDRPSDPHAFLKKLRQQYDRVAFFDDDDSSSSPYLDLLPYVDIFWKKQLLKDLSLYSKPLYGNRVFSDHYHRRQSVTEPNPGCYPLADVQHLHKLTVGWNLGIGSYPLRYWKEKVAKELFPVLGSAVSRLLVTAPWKRQDFSKPKSAFCQARYARNDSPAIGYQRELFANLLEGQSRVSFGFLDRQSYRREMATAAAVLSPFGWGEICYRDFEAFQQGCVLVKPAMDHLNTWPQCYRPGETFVPVNWDGTDLLSTINEVLDNPVRGRQMCETAFEVWADSFRQIDDRVENLLSEFYGRS